MKFEAGKSEARKSEARNSEARKSEARDYAELVLDVVIRMSPSCFLFDPLFSK